MLVSGFIDEELKASLRPRPKRRRCRTAEEGAIDLEPPHRHTCTCACIHTYMDSCACTCTHVLPQCYINTYVLEADSGAGGVVRRQTQPQDCIMWVPKGGAVWGSGESTRLLRKGIITGTSHQGQGPTGRAGVERGMPQPWAQDRGHKSGATPRASTGLLW